MPYATLPERGLLALSGDDTLAFLQGLVSNDVLHLKDGGIAYAALLTPQGKFLHDFFLLGQDRRILIDCSLPRLPDLHQRLMRYRLRSKVAMEPVEYGVAAVWGEALPAAEELPVFADPRLAALGFRVYGSVDQLNAWCKKQSITQARAEDYDTHRLQLGVPEGGSDMVAEKSFLLPFGFEDLHGVDFHKGCYIGQEVTARSKHLGNIRKRIYKVAGSRNSLPAAGTPVYHGEILAGEMRSSRRGIGLALLEVAEVEKSRNSKQSLSVDGQPIVATMPEWIKSANVTMA